MFFIKQSDLTKKVFSFVLLGSFVFSNAFAFQVFAQTVNQHSIENGILGKYTADLTNLARQGRLRVNSNFDTEVNALVKMLESNDPRQPAILD